MVRKGGSGSDQLKCYIVNKKKEVKINKEVKNILEISKIVFIKKNS